MKLTERLSRWWADAHQRGIFMHCTGMLLPCFLDNVAHWVLRRETTWADWPCRWHHKAGDRVGEKWADSPAEAIEWRVEAAMSYVKNDQMVTRARRIRALGWGR